MVLNARYRANGANIFNPDNRKDFFVGPNFSGRAAVIIGVEGDVRWGKLFTFDKN